MEIQEKHTFFSSSPSFVLIHFSTPFLMLGTTIDTNHLWNAYVSTNVDDGVTAKLLAVLPDVHRPIPRMVLLNLAAF